VDAKLCSRQQELYHVKQELDKVSQELEEAAESKQHLQFASSDLQNTAAKTVTKVCHWYRFSVILFCYLTFNQFIISWCCCCFIMLKILETVRHGSGTGCVLGTLGLPIPSPAANPTPSSVIGAHLVNLVIHSCHCSCRYLPLFAW